MLNIAKTAMINSSEDEQKIEISRMLIDWMFSIGLLSFSFQVQQLTQILREK